jgi:hypothetical protein
MVRKAEGSNFWQYSWDHENHLTKTPASPPIPIACSGIHILAADGMAKCEECEEC